MKSNTKRIENDEIPDILLEGLALDVSILDALLKRHRCSHGRTIYFRRMSMTLNRLLRREKNSDRKSKKIITVTDMVYRLKNVKVKISEYNEDQKFKSSGRKRRHNEEEEKWDIESLRKTSATATSLSPTKAIVQELEVLTKFWTGNIPEILSRIHHASKSLFIEVSRGFFLPFCTVALSALARIRSLLMDIGLRGLTSIRSLSDEALQVFPKNDVKTLQPIVVDTDYEAYINLFLENDDNEIDRKRKILMKNISATQDIRCDRKAILRSLGLMESTRSNSKASGGPTYDDSDVPTTSNQMNDKQSDDSSAIEPSSTNDYFTLASSEKDSDLGKAVDNGNPVDMDDVVDDDNSAMPSKPQDAFDRNMTLVNKFKKRKTSEKVSKKKEKTAKKNAGDSKLEAPPEESERKSKKRKHKKSESSKKKKKKKEKGDFFDQIFD